MVKKKTTTEFIEQAIKVHGNRFDYSKVNYINARTKIIIICSIHGEFKQRPNDHLINNGCSYCSYDLRKLTIEEFVKKARRKHGDKYGYDNVNYVNYDTEIQINCNKHGVYLQTPNNHLNGYGCNVCKKQTLKEKFIKKAKEKHENKYNYKNIHYKNNKTKISIKCNKHGMFWQAPHHHLDGRGCPSCNYENQKSNTKEFVERAIELYNNFYDYSKVDYIDAQTKTIIICPKHGEFQQKPNNHLNNHGCPKCSSRISKMETQWLDSLNIPSKYRQKRLEISGRILQPDGFDPKTNTVYEFYGDFWHGNPRIYKQNDINDKTKTTFKECYDRTIERENLIKSAGYKLVTMWEDDWKNK